MMQTKTIAAIIVVGIVAVAGATYVYFPKSSGNTQEPIQTNIPKTITFKDVVGQNGSYKCTITQTVNNAPVKGLVYLDKDRVKAEVQMNYQGKLAGVYLIVREGYVYTWSSVMGNMGYKLKQQMGTSTEGVAFANGYLENVNDYKCDAWKVDESIFALPTTISFIEPKK